MSAQLALAEQADTAVPLDDLMRRVARELRIGAAIADDCQDALGDAGVALDAGAAVRLQGLDLLSQQLVEIGRLLDRLAEAGMSGVAPAGSLEAVRLSDVQARLAGRAIGLKPVVETEMW